MATETQGEAMRQSDIDFLLVVRYRSMSGCGLLEILRGVTFNGFYWEAFNGNQ